MNIASAVTNRTFVTVFTSGVHSDNIFSVHHLFNAAYSLKLSFDFSAFCINCLHRFDSIQFNMQLSCKVLPSSHQSFCCIDDELNGIESIIIQLCMIVFSSFEIWFKVFLFAPHQISSKVQRNIQLKVINFCQRNEKK